VLSNTVRRHDTKLHRIVLIYFIYPNFDVNVYDARRILIVNSRQHEYKLQSITIIRE